MFEAWIQWLLGHYWAVLLLGAALFGAMDLLFRGSTSSATLARQWALHAALYGLGLVLLLQIPISMAAATAASARLQFGLGTWISFGPAGNFLTWVVCYTLTQYWFHRAGHQLRLLWALHRVHHLDEILDASSTLRHHPGEAIAGLLVFSALAFVLAPPLSAIVIWSMVELLVDFWTHGRTPVSDRLAHKLEWVIFTPRLHRVHHSAHLPQTNSNYGNVLVFWDRLFGTFRRETPLRLGLDDPDASGAASRDFDRLLLDPVTYLRGTSRKAR